MKRWLLLVIASAGFLTGCAEDALYNRQDGGYGASLTMGGGSGVRGVYPDAALYANEFAITNEYAAGMIADLRTGPVGVGGLGTEAGQISGAAAGAAYYNPYAPTIELIVPDYVNPYAPTLELVVPAEIAVDSNVTGETSPIVPAPTLPADPPPVPTPEPQAEPPSAPTGPGKPL